MTIQTLGRCGLALMLAAASLLSWAQATTPAALLAAYTVEAGVAASPERGQKLHTTNFGREMGWSCSSCHGRRPTDDGRNEVSEKPIRALAPAFNPARFTNKVTVENAFRLNCRDVVGRDCSAGEKADVLSWLMSLKP